MNLIKKLSLFSLTLFTLAQAHIYEAEKWVNQSTGQEIALLGDYHDSAKEQNQINVIQRDILLDRAKTLDATLIVEDGFAKSTLCTDPLNYDHNKHPVIPAKESNDRTLLHGLTGQCHKKGVKVHNAEFRLPELSTSSMLLIQKIEQAKAQIEQYDDASHCNEYYKRKLEELRIHVEEPCKELFDRLRKSTANVKDTCEKIKYKSVYNTVLEYFWGHDEFDTLYDKVNHIIIGYEARLLDLKIVHAIAQTKGHIIVCAGANHINRIKPALQLMRFADNNYQGSEYCDDNEEPDALDMTKTLHAFYGAENTAKPTVNYFIIYMMIVLSILLLIAVASIMLNRRRHIYIS